MPVDPNVGTILHGYELEQVLGQGGMGVVYRAYDPALDRHVAVKLITPELASDPAFRARFLSESRFAAALDHPHILPVYAAGEECGRMYLVTRLVEGGNLRDQISPGGMPPRRAIDLLTQLAQALDAAHARGLVHRDVKPSNVLVESGDHVFLGDFGLARSVADPFTEAGPGASLGSIDYVAPEQIRGDTVDGQADVYSLACLLHECLTGTLPYPGGTEAAVLFAHLEAPPPDADLAPSTLRRGLAKNPADRPQSCVDLIESARDELGLGARRRRLAGVAVAVAAAAAVIAGIALLVTSPGGATASASGRLVKIDPVTRRVTAKHLGNGPDSLVVKHGRVWMASARDARLWNVDPATLAAVHVPTAADSSDLAIGDGYAWVVANGRLFKYGSQTGKEYTTPTIPEDASLVRVGAGSVWLIGPDHVYQVTGGRFTDFANQSVKLPDHNDSESRWDVSAAVLSDGRLWVAGDALDPQVWEVDLNHPKAPVHTVELPPGSAPVALAAGSHAIWVADQIRDRVYRIDPATHTVSRSIAVGREPSSLAASADGIWVANTIDDTVQHIDPQTNAVDVTIAVPTRPLRIAVGAGGVWVAGDAA